MTLHARRICLHMWRRRTRVHSWTRGRTVRACSSCRRAWSRTPETENI